MGLELGKKIKQISENKGVAVKALAEGIGLTEQQVYRIFKQNHLSTDTLEKISQVLDVPISIFFQEFSTDDLLIVRGGTGLGKVAILERIKRNISDSENNQFFLRQIEDLRNDKDELRRDKDRLIKQLEDALREVQELKQKLS